MMALKKMLEQEPGEIEMLLPWYAAGTLNKRDARRVEEALARDPELARQYAERGVELYPTWGHFHAHLGAVAFGHGHLEDAAAELERAVAGEWHNDAEGLSRALATLAATELRLHDYVKAQEFAGRASVWLPQWIAPHLIRGQALQALGLSDEALREFRTTSELSGRREGGRTTSAF